MAEVCKVPILELYQNYIWPLYKLEKYDHPLTFLKQLLVYLPSYQDMNRNKQNLELRIKKLNSVFCKNSGEGSNVLSSKPWLTSVFLADPSKESQQLGEP